MSLRAERSAPRSAHLREIRWGVASSVGNRRHHNEDAVLAGPHWFVVADGMGGHLAGEVASSVAVATFAAAPPPSADLPTALEEIGGVVAAANAAVGARADADRIDGMGTTVVGVVDVAHGASSSVVVFHVGDSRCYRLLDGSLTLLTTDHSHVQELVDAGRISPADAATHPLRNVLTRAVGVDRRVEPDIATIDRPGRLLLCSDGLSGELDARSIGRILASVADPQAAADRLVRLALSGAARDNVTALVVDVAEARR